MPSFDTVDNPQLLEVVLSPPSGFTRLFVFTGTAVAQLPLFGPRDDDNFTRDRLDLFLSRVHGNKPFNRSRLRLSLAHHQVLYTAPTAQTNCHGPLTVLLLILATKANSSFMLMRPYRETVDCFPGSRIRCSCKRPEC